MVFLEVIRPMKLELKGITKEFDQGNGNTVVTLEDISFEINDKEIVGILGPSGCGKTTLLRIIAGLERPTKGAVLLDGVPVTKPGARMGMIFQEHALLPWRSVLENVSLGLEILEIPPIQRQEKAMSYLDLVGLKDSSKSRPYELSGGMRQRAAVARALVLEPSLLLMDEPFSALDPQTRKQIQADILRIQEKTSKAIVLVTHSVEEAIFLADKLIILSARPGKVQKILEVKLERPRDRMSLQFLEMREEVLGYLDGRTP
ncbi:Trehalose/maltose import ATP-binding protein MalK [uncultured archaeon]|nr:Trehalose/maltose import ATP-binding protein MalK [uncultured archaeon]